jgi:hypothetical protein
MVKVGALKNCVSTYYSNLNLITKRRNHLRAKEIMDDNLQALSILVGLSMVNNWQVKGRNTDSYFLKQFR